MAVPDVRDEGRGMADSAPPLVVEVEPGRGIPDRIGMPDDTRRLRSIIDELVAGISMNGGWWWRGGELSGWQRVCVVLMHDAAFQIVKSGERIGVGSGKSQKIHTAQLRLNIGILEATQPFHPPSRLCSAPPPSPYSS